MNLTKINMFISIINQNTIKMLGCCFLLLLFIIVVAFAAGGGAGRCEVLISSIPRGVWQTQGNL